MVFLKIAGLASIIIGGFFVFSFPYIKDYTPDKFAHAGILIGIALIILGIYLMQA